MNSEKLFQSVSLNSFSTSGISLPAVSLLSSVLLNLNDAVKGLLPSNISMNGMSFRWYMALTPFETFFLGFIIFMVFVLRYIEVLPINLNNWMHGDPYSNGTGVLVMPSNPQSLNCLDELSESAFELIIKLDQEECFRKAICILGSDSKKLISIESRKLVDRTMGIFKRLSKLRKHCKESSIHKGYDSIEAAMYSVGTKNTSQPHRNGTTYTICDTKYGLCPSTTHDILNYLDIIFTNLKDLL